MKPKFTPLELLKFAISIEEDGYDFYMRHAKKASGDQKNLLEKLANDEEQHAAIFKKIYNEFDNGSKDFDYLYGIDTEAVFKSYSNSEVFAARKEVCEDVRDAFYIAAKTEKMTVDYYKDLLKYAKAPLVEVLERLIKEEEGHYEEIMSIIGE